MGAAAGRFSVGRALGRQTIDLDLPLAVGRRQLPAVDEILELLLVLVGVPVRLVPQHASLLDEVFERRAGVTGGAETEPRGCRGRGKSAARTAPGQQLGRDEREA